MIVLQADSMHRPPSSDGVSVFHCLLLHCLIRLLPSSLKGRLCKGFSCCQHCSALWQGKTQAADIPTSHQQQVTVADKQVQTGGKLERTPTLRSNSRTGTLQTSLSMRSTRPVLGETTLNMLEVSMLQL